MIEIQLEPHHKTLPVGTISAGAGDDSCGEAGDPGVEKVAGDSCTSAPRGGGGRGRRRTSRDLTAGRTWTGSASPKDDGRDGDERGAGPGPAPPPPRTTAGTGGGAGPGPAPPPKDRRQPPGIAGGRGVAGGCW